MPATKLPRALCAKKVECLFVKVTGPSPLRPRLPRRVTVQHTQADMYNISVQAPRFADTSLVVLLPILRYMHTGFSQHHAGATSQTLATADRRDQPDVPAYD